MKINRVVRFGRVGACPDLRGLAVVAVLWAGVAGADPYCKPDMAELAKLPASLAGDWTGTLVQALAVVDGKPQGVPAADTPLPAKIAAGPGGIRLQDATMPDAPVLTATTGDAEFALPGESPLGAVEFLGPLLEGVTCAAVDLPQFAGQMPPAQGMGTTLRAFVLSGNEMLLVMMVRQAAEPAQNGVRAVLRYRR